MKAVAVGVGLMVVVGFALEVFCDAVGDGLGVEARSLSLAHPESPKPIATTRLTPPAVINAFAGLFTFCISGAYLPVTSEFGGHSGSHNLNITLKKVHRCSKN